MSLKPLSVEMEGTFCESVKRQAVPFAVDHYEEAVYQNEHCEVVEH